MNKPKTFVMREGPPPPKHTPGPWKPALVDIGIFKLGWMVDAVFTAGNHRKTGLVQVFADPDNAEQMAVAEADARLIAAAPELLEAAKRVLNAMPAIAKDDDETKALRAAVAKAEGEK